MSLDTTGSTGDSYSRQHTSDETLEQGHDIPASELQSRRPWSLQTGNVGNRGLGSESRGYVCSVHGAEDSGFLLSANGWYFFFFKGCVFRLKLQPTVTVLRTETLGDDLTPAKGCGRRGSVTFVLLILLNDITSPPCWRIQPLGTIFKAELPSPGLQLARFPSWKKHFLPFINFPASVLLLYQHPWTETE